VEDTVSLFEKDKNISDRISVEKDYEADVWVEFDPSNLRQVLWNLLLNAAEAVEEDGRIAIMVRNSGGHGVVEIADNGCGISPEQIKSIFSPFFTTKAEGTGLGLSIVHSILESYESTLDVESSEGRGTRMILKIKSAQPPTKA
jgi:two-component system sensor histidine kinase PilS (NtrC family)